jgi:hypothetical protein
MRYELLSGDEPDATVIATSALHPKAAVPTLLGKCPLTHARQLACRLLGMTASGSSIPSQAEARLADSIAGRPSVLIRIGTPLCGDPASESALIDKSTCSVFVKILQPISAK